jgi:hypothetical protein
MSITHTRISKRLSGGGDRLRFSLGFRFRLMAVGIGLVLEQVLGLV